MMHGPDQSQALPPADNALMIARQPVYDDQMEVFGYELLFRRQTSDQGLVPSAQATAHVLAAALLNADIASLVFERKAVFNVTRAFVDVIQQVPLPPGQMVLDLPDDMKVDADLLGVLKELKTQGYEIAIGGFATLREPRLLEIADSFRVDVRRLQLDQVDRLTGFLRRWKNLSLRALKVETLEECERYRTLGYDFFQGFFLGSPRIHQVRDLSVSKIAIMQLLTVVHDLNTPIEQLEEKIACDVSLSFKLLKLVNSPYFGVAAKVDSIKRAIVLLGRDEIRKIVSLLALRGIDDQPQAMLEIALVRAKTCELLGKEAAGAVDGFFTVGMFSALDALMNQPIECVIDQLPLSEPVRAAILDHSGTMGEALSCTLAIEKACWSDIGFLDLDAWEIFSASAEAIDWANGVLRRL